MKGWERPGRHAKKRESFLVLPSKDMEDGSGEAPKYPDFVSMTKAVLCELMLPERTCDDLGDWVWTDGDEPLIPEGFEFLLEFFDEHGPRHWLDSAAAAVGAARHYSMMSYASVACFMRLLDRAHTFEVGHP